MASLGHTGLSFFPLGSPPTVPVIVPTTLHVVLTFPPITVSAVATIIPAPLRLTLTFPQPTVKFLVGGGIVPKRLAIVISFPPLTVTGGDQRLQVFIGGINIKPFLQLGNKNGPDCQLISQTQGRWTATFTGIDKTGDGIGALIPTDPTRGLGQSVIVTEGGRRRFMGCLNQVQANRWLKTDASVYTLSCVDKSGICDHRIVSAKYPAGMDIADIVRDIWESDLGGEGITIRGVPATLGGVSVDQAYNFVTVTQAFNALATDGLCSWWVDVYGDLNFVLITDLPAAPFSITENSANWRDMQTTATLTNYRNKQYALSNLSTSPGAVPTTTETYTLPQAAAVAAGFRLGTIILNLPASQITGLTVNGISQPVRNGYDLGLNFDGSWWAILPTQYLYAPDSTLPTPQSPQDFVPGQYYDAGMICTYLGTYYSRNTSGTAGVSFPADSSHWTATSPPAFAGLPYYQPVSPFPQVGDVIAITYIPNVSNAQLVEAAVLAPSLPGLMKCGSGIYEAVEQVQNISSLSDLLAIAQAVLARSGTVPLSVQFTTFTPGLEVGQILPANIPKCQLPPGTELVITGVTATHLGFIVDRDGNRTAGHGSAFSWAITAATGGDQLNALLMFEKLIQRTQNALPIVQYDQTTFILAPGESLSGGVVATNPQFIRTNGRLAEVVVQCGVAPGDQTLLIDIVNSSFGSILKSPIAISDGFPHVITAFVNDPGPTYILVNQSFTVSSSYKVTGADPTLASSVSVLIRWYI